jgi:imidazolonepropionase-like amidohydrolase
MNPVAESSWLIFKNVTVIDMKGGLPKSGMTVVIHGTRIVATGNSTVIRTIAIPKNALTIDGRRKFLLPAFWDMHAHLGTDDFDKNSYLPLFIANGVTSIRIMDGEPEYHQWRKEIENGSLIGPRMFIASRVVGFSDSSNISAGGAREEVKRAKKEGADFVKVHDNIPRQSYFALIEEGKRLNLPVQGHVPTSISAAEASAAGQKSIEHSTGLDEAKSDESKAKVLSALFKMNRTWLCPTLIMRNNYATLDNQALARDTRLKYVKPSWRNRWLGMTKAAADMPTAEWSKRKEMIRKEKILVGRMQQAGVGILAGTDDANPYAMVGFGLHDELAMLVDAGLTPIQALQAATLNPAKFFDKLDSLGTIEKGKLADLVLLDANPLTDIRNTKRISAVVVNGNYFSPAALHKILADVESAAK